MTEQLSFVAKIDPDELVDEVVATHSPVASVALFSGGNDSTVLAHRMRDRYESLAFIDTGTALPGVRDFVESFAEWLGKPLRVLEAGDAYRQLILGLYRKDPPPGWRPYGFPGPAGHHRAYNLLKLPSLRRLRSDLQAGKRGAKVLYLTGLRRAESAQRKSRAAVTLNGAMVFTNPLVDWTGDAVRAYRAEHELPQSDVAALIHRSGECNCGCFAAPGEREMLASLFPEWWQRMASLEVEAAAAGVVSCRWGDEKASGPPPTADDPLCSDCAMRLFA